MTVRGLAILVLALLTPVNPAVAAPARLTEAQVRDFVVRQSAAWNRGDLDAYFATFAASARFTDQALANSNTIVPYGSSSVKEARAQVRKTFAKGKTGETLTIDRVTLAPDGRGARVAAHAVSLSGGKPFCAQRVETVALTSRGLLATGQTDTIVRCRAAPVR